MPNGGFDTAFSDWESCHPPEYQALQGGVANFSWYAGPTLGSRGGYLATNVGVVGGNRACRRLAGAPTNGSSPHVFTAWVRSEDGSDVPWSTLQLSGTVHTFSTIDPNDYYGSSDAQVTSATVFTAKANWQKISVRWWPPSGTDGKQTFRDSFYASVVPGAPGKTILVDEVTEVGPLTANPCGGFWSRSACFGTPQPLDPPINTDLEPLKLLTDGQATFIHDPLRTRCLKLESDRTVKIVVYSAAACTTFLPFADLDTTGLPTFSGWTLWAGYDSCLTSTATGVRVEECDGTNAQRFFDILTSDSPLTFTVRNVASGFCLDGVTFGQATFNACSGGSTQTWADAAKNGSPVGPPVGTIPQSPEEGMHLQGTEADDRFDIEQENILLPAGSWGGDVFSKLGTVEEVMGFINPIHKLVQIDIARKLVAQGKEAWIECTGLGNTFPDICTPPKPSIGYRHAEVKPGNFGVMAPSTAAIAAAQLTSRDARMIAKGFPAGSYRATANDGWPVAGSITVGTSIIPVGFKIDYVLQSPGLYVYRTNFRDVVLTGVLARALRDILRDDYGSRLTDLINEIRVRFPNPQSPAARWIKQHKGAIPKIVIGVVIAGVIVTAIVVAPVAIGPALIGGTGVGLGFGIG